MEGPKRDLNQGFESGIYSILKVFGHPEKLEAIAEGKVSAPIYVRLKPTNRCNHGCFYCVYNEDFSGIHPDVKARTEISREKLLEIIDDFKDMGVKAVTLSGGGEPLLHPHIGDAMEKIQEYKIDLSIITNGQNLSGRNAELLGNAFWVRVSADYCDAEMLQKIRGKGGSTFSRWENNMKSFAKTKSKNCSFDANCVVHEYNADRLEEIAGFLKDLGVDNLRFAPTWLKNFQDYHAPFKDRALAQIEAAKKLATDDFKVGSSYGRYFSGTGDEQRTYPRCFMMEYVPVIAADQGVYTCHNKAYDPKGKIGSIEHQKFKDLWFSGETKRFFSDFDPRERCHHECAGDQKNILLTEYVACRNPRVVNFV